MTAPEDDPNAQGASGKKAADDNADLAQAYRDIARGEQTASALEANLTNLESKLDAMLAAFEAAAQDGEADAKKDEKKDNGGGS